MNEKSELEGYTVLVVEDHQFSRATLVSLLQRLGVESVLTAKDGIEAETALNSNKIDAVITDINMPNMNGIELLKSIRMGKTANKCDMRVLAVTSYSNVEVIRACMSLDISAFLVKPITIDNVKTKLITALEESADLSNQKNYSEVESDFDCISENPTARKADKHQPDRTLNKKINWPYGKAQPKEEPPRVLPEKIKGKSISYMTVSQVTNLESGMILMQDLCAKNGVCLIASGVVLNGRLINRLHELSSIIELDQLKVKMLVEEAKNS
ncbi:response regulator [Vibrio tapetis]|uniref:Putative CheY-like receiver n=1 Tax=Vibrio tapetis subsp. tapetis TaxID=1671868 RepID=A0A2N8ZML3_9VIBR|nr:response regulator [Vibrio tapetis]SON53145.1 putative CheY-like receiver [Vibrio tapetis subsp. tapetis]